MWLTNKYIGSCSHISPVGCRARVQQDSTEQGSVCPNVWRTGWVSGWSQQQKAELKRLFIYHYYCWCWRGSKWPLQPVLILRNSKCILNLTTTLEQVGTRPCLLWTVCKHLQTRKTSCWTSGREMKEWRRRKQWSLCAKE